MTDADAELGTSGKFLICSLIKNDFLKGGRGGTAELAT